MKIGYSDFLQLCRVDDPQTWCEWLSVKGDGVYVKEGAIRSSLTPEERAALTEHPTGNLSEPALCFPCGLGDLRNFLESQGIYGCIDPFDLADWVIAANGSAAVDAQRPAPTDKLIGGFLFKRDCVGLVTLSRLVAQKERVSEAEACDYVTGRISKLELDIYSTNWQSGPELLGKACFTPLCDYITEIFNCGWWNRPEALELEIVQSGMLPDELAITWRDAERHFGLRPTSSSFGHDNDQNAMFDDQRWPEELDIAITAWRAACNQADKAGKRPGAFIREWLEQNCKGLTSEAVKRIATVANWDKSPGTGKK